MNVPPLHCGLHSLDTGMYLLNANHAGQIYFPVLLFSLLSPHPRFMKCMDLLFKQSLKSSDLQISSLNDPLYIFCI